MNLYEAKTQVSELVEHAAAGEDVVISKNGVPRARLIAVPAFGARRKPVDAMKISYVDADFDVPDRGIERLFYVNE